MVSPMSGLNCVLKSTPFLTLAMACSTIFFLMGRLSQKLLAEVKVRHACNLYRTDCGIVRTPHRRDTKYTSPT